MVVRRLDFLAWPAVLSWAICTSFLELTMELLASLPAQKFFDSLNNEVQMIDVRKMRSQDAGDTLTSSELLGKIQSLA